MAGGMNRKISAASARAHTRKAKQNSFLSLPPGVLKKILLVLSVGILAWAYQVIQPPAPKTCGSQGGPPITAPRIKLRDGRHLAYKEHGVPKDVAKFKIIFIHGIDNCRHDFAFANISPEIVKELGIYFLSFDRPGYGESDPHPTRTVKSHALDVEELADQLGLGSKFYVIGFSLGGEMTWGCLKYIPHRLAGVTLLTPVVNYWWPNLPSNLSTEAYNQQLRQDQWAVRVAHYAPWVTYWWNTQKWFPASGVLTKNPAVFSRQDIEIISQMSKEQANQAIQVKKYVRQQGVHESIYRDMTIGFGTWEFDPMDLENPFPNNEGSVHLWHGDEDGLVPVLLQRYIAQQLPWIHYHELPGSGHLFPLIGQISEAIIKAMLVGEH